MEEKVVLCDTNIFIEIYRGNAGIFNQLKKIGLNNIAVSHITCGELLFGARNKMELIKIKKELNALTVFPIEKEISKSAIDLIEKYSLSHKLSLPDALIGANAIHYNIEHFTLNVKDFSYINSIRFYEMK